MQYLIAVTSVVIIGLFCIWKSFTNGDNNRVAMSLIGVFYLSMATCVIYPLYGQPMWVLSIIGLLMWWAFDTAVVLTTTKYVVWARVGNLLGFVAFAVLFFPTQVVTVEQPVQQIKCDLKKSLCT